MQLLVSHSYATSSFETGSSSSKHLGSLEPEKDNLCKQGASLKKNNKNILKQNYLHSDQQIVKTRFAVSATTLQKLVRISKDELAQGAGE